MLGGLGTDATVTAGEHRVAFLDLSRQSLALRAELDRAIDAVVASGRYILGENVARFEAEFAAWCGVAHGIGVASGTDALELALRALRIGPGDEVITVANAGAPTICAILASGASPILVDIDPSTYTMDPVRLEERLSTRTRALVPVHLYGQCADMQSIGEIAHRRGLHVVEDCAQAHGATFDGRRAGSLGTVSCFSFYPTKNLGALGDGGMVLTDEPGIAQAVRELRMYGERESRHSERSGRNSRLDEIQAAVLLVKLRYLERWNERRRILAAAYSAGLAGSGVRTPAEAKGRMHVYHLYVVRTAGRDELRRRLSEAGIGSMVHYERPVHHHAAWPDLLAQAAWLPETERAAAEVLSLPLYPDMTDDELESVIHTVRSVSRA